MTILAVDDEIGALTALRQKIEVNVKEMIRSIRGYGYIFQDI